LREQGAFACGRGAISQQKGPPTMPLEMPDTLASQGHAPPRQDAAEAILARLEGIFWRLCMGLKAHKKRFANWRRIVQTREVDRLPIASREDKGGAWLPGFAHRLGLPICAADDDDLAEARLVARLRRQEANAKRAALVDRPVLLTIGNLPA